LTTSKASLGRTVELLLSREDRRFGDVEHEQMLPAEEASPKFLERVTQAQEACETAYLKFLEARAQLDRLAFEVYEIDREDWQRAIISGVPWAVEGKEEMERLMGVLFR